MSQPPLVWLPMLWAMIPRHPLLPADLTAACRSQCPTRKEKAVAKQVNISQAFILHPTDPIFLSLWNNVCVLPFFCWNLCLILVVWPACLSVVSQPADEGTGMPTVKRRRVTAEMEGKYIINMPKGTTPRTRRILAQQAKKGRPDPVASTGNPLH